MNNTSPVQITYNPIEIPIIHQPSFVEQGCKKVGEAFGEFITKAAFLATHVEPLEKVLKLIYYSGGLVKSLGGNVSASFENLSSQIKSFNDFSDMLKGIRSLCDWYEFKKMMQNSCYRIANRASLLAAGIFASVRWFDRNLDGCFGNISTWQIGKFPILSSAKDAFVMLASVFSTCEYGMALPNAHSKSSEAAAKLEKWTFKGIETQQMQNGDQIAVEAKRLNLQAKIRKLADDQSVEGKAKVEKYSQRLQKSNEDLVVELVKQANLKTRLWSTRSHNADLNVEKNWLAIANDVTKFIAISLVFVIIGTSITAGAIIITLGIMSLINNTIGVRKALFEEFDYKMLPEPKAIQATLIK